MVRRGVPEIYLGAAPAEIMALSYSKQRAALVEHVHARAAQINQMAEVGETPPDADRPAP
jgi:hypothetical protein